MQIATLTAIIAILLAACVLYLTATPRIEPRQLDNARQYPRLATSTITESAPAKKPATTASSVNDKSASKLNDYQTASVVSASTQTNKSVDEILRHLQESAFTYDAKALEDIQPYLCAKDPIIRQAALDAVVTLGDSKGADILRTAAKTMDDSAEIAELHDKADYLELPPISLFSPETIRAIRALKAQRSTTRLPRGSSLREQIPSPTPIAPNSD